eukprot:CAMPEP_0118667010 /NCGR_PEP_ID=MMETSP0785-20121206/19542_1 /TAXON_ID=91992 /ORGANISM="Bolidomonas pacifica, Strain CCMP 1866" /LENGTH=122 /DNA_ID=CAMNT_0006561403 /DNA_START=111 /DNA_END=476 /DNA_ORIENTATION=-
MWCHYNLDLTSSTTSSISKAFNFGNGLFKPVRFTTFKPDGWIVITKEPLVGGVGFIETLAIPDKPFSTFAARVLNAPHSLLASISTSGREVEEAFDELVDDDFDAAFDAFAGVVLLVFLAFP